MNVGFEKFQAEFYLWNIEISPLGGIGITRECRDKSGCEQLIGMCTRKYFDSMKDFEGAYLLNHPLSEDKQILFQQYEDKLVINRLVFDLFPDDRILYLMNIYLKFCNQKGSIIDTI